jgi:hypothetical protein
MDCFNLKKEKEETRGKGKKSREGVKYNNTFLSKYYIPRYYTFFI